MITRSKSKIMSANPDAVLAPPQPHSSVPQGDRAPSVHSAQSKSKSSRSSATVKAQKAAAEAIALRRRLEREQQLAAHERDREQALAARERERELQLAELQRQVEECELQAELQAIDAEAGSSCAGRSHSDQVSVNRTKKWVENHPFNDNCGDRDMDIPFNDNCGDRDIPAVGCEPLSGPSPGHTVPPPMATRVPAFPMNLLNRQSEPAVGCEPLLGPSPGHTVQSPMATRVSAFPINPLHRQSEPVNATKASEAAGYMPPLFPTELGQPVLLQAVADTAAAAKALASASSVKKLELPQFFGNTLQWLQFKRIYNVTKNNFSPLDNINRLHNALRGPARDAVAALLMSTEDPEEVMRALEDNFARPELIVYKEVNSLKNLPRLGNDLKELGVLSNKTWRSNIDWDTELPQTESSKWFEWFQELLKVSSLKIPRWYSKIKGSEPSYRELHVFADASELAYACVAYWRLVYPDGSIELILIASKTRVSPLKPISIPRLELQAALIASRLALVIKDSHRKKPTRTYFWTDSMTVLQWLRSDARAFKPFVAHRLGEILENSAVKDWHWVPTDLNVADDATRLRPIDLTLSHRWFFGPSFLLKSPEDWPTEPLNVTSNLEELKCQPIESVAVTSVNGVLPNPVTANLEYFNDWLRLLRATARVHQAVAIFGNILASIRNSKVKNGAVPSRSRCSSTSTTHTPLNADLIKAAERHILQRIQLDSFSEEFHCIINSKPIPSNSRLTKLSPSLGEDNLIHLAGRIKAVEDIDPETRSPILLDGRHPIARLLVQLYHRRAGHANNEYVINDIRQRFWLLRLRDTVRSVAHKCLFCKIRKSKPMNPATGDLPPQRLAHHQRAFTFTGLDYFGPVNVTVGRRHEKRYVALYTCLTTRALHLELVHSLSSDSAIMSLRRFIARRGIPNTIYSDNGTAFVGADRILRQFYSDGMKEEAATRGIRWSFIPAAAPSFGGCWERLVRTVKVALKATLNERFPKEETLMTLLMEAEAIANSRPLTHVSTDPEDPTALTPFHFLIGSPSNQTLPSALEDRDLFGRLEWKKAIRLSDHFWKRWVREVLPTMQTRVNVKGDRGQELQIGDVVIIVDESLPRGTWPKGRITNMFPGKDGVNRVVDVATAGGTLRRPLKKLIRIT
ncbi:uncharacterized protein LOC125230713 isoform X2 [Leguminivora glycinivorella]|uniref:uncharacterized protein LOC125230713 isoform X2 n=1 Tax=Leguminivora glycinivorella TaxID=1035111 RepID=UPI00200BD617|nr:uncharacterized protein LOC125230713 isoform X2 [Leguminivora glycinivorella]